MKSSPITFVRASALQITFRVALISLSVALLTLTAAAQIQPERISPRWVPTGSMITPRYYHTATLLPSGKVLVAGGYDDNAAPLNSAELYDPATGLWTATGNLGAARAVHTATLLPSGEVLVAGGDNAITALSSAELYDSATGLWTRTSSMETPRGIHTATLLQSGEVLVAGVPTMVVA